MSDIFPVSVDVISINNEFLWFHYNYYIYVSLLLLGITIYHLNLSLLPIFYIIMLNIKSMA